MRLSLNRLIFSLPPAIKISVTLCANAFSRCSTAQKHEVCPEYFFIVVRNNFIRATAVVQTRACLTLLFLLQWPKLVVKGRLYSMLKANV